MSFNAGQKPDINTELTQFSEKIANASGIRSKDGKITWKKEPSGLFERFIRLICGASSKLRERLNVVDVEDAQKEVQSLKGRISEEHELSADAAKLFYKTVNTTQSIFQQPISINELALTAGGQSRSGIKEALVQEWVAINSERVKIGQPLVFNPNEQIDALEFKKRLEALKDKHSDVDPSFDLMGCTWFQKPHLEAIKEVFPNVKNIYMPGVVRNQSTLPLGHTSLTRQDINEVFNKVVIRDTTTRQQMGSFIAELKGDIPESQSPVPQENVAEIPAAEKPKSQEKPAPSTLAYPNIAKPGTKGDFLLGSHSKPVQAGQAPEMDQSTKSLVITI